MTAATTAAATTTVVVKHAGLGRGVVDQRPDSHPSPVGVGLRSVIFDVYPHLDLSAVIQHSCASDGRSETCVVFLTDQVVEAMI